RPCELAGHGRPLDPLLGLAMPGMGTAATAELLELEAVGVVPPVLDRCVVALLAVWTLQGDDRGATLRRCHVLLPRQKRNLAALGQARLYQRPAEIVHERAGGAVGTIARRGPK